MFIPSTGFFELDQRKKNIFSSLNVGDVSPSIKTQGFLTFNETARGVEINGIDQKSFSTTTGLGIEVDEGEVAVGKELSKQLNLEVGNDLTLAFPKGNQNFSSLPLIKSFKVGSIVDHGIYQKNLRLVYVKLNDLQSLLGVDDRVNILLLNHKKSQFEDLDKDDYSERILNLRSSVDRELGESFIVRPYWSEFGTLIEVVDIEKTIIGLILQMVVLISIFNVLAFVIFINEKKAKELFLFKAMGMSQKSLVKVWLMVILAIWVGASSLSIFLVRIFDWMLQNLSIFSLPGDIYHLGRIKIVLGMGEYSLVFSLTLLWLLLISWIALVRLKKSLLANLRREFS